MNYLIYNPYITKSYNFLHTTAFPHIQLWQELSSIKFQNNSLASIDNKEIDPWINQAKIYYHDAFKSNWKSGGLLYYYSFLNLSKAILGYKGKINISELKSESVYHGLSSNPQNPERIIDFEIEIHPPISRNKKNIFSNFYEEITKSIWPFEKNITVKLSDFIGYCEEISHESLSFYQILKKQIDCRALIRDNDKNLWIEFMAVNSAVDDFMIELKAHKPTILPFNKMSDEDKMAWQKGHNLSNKQLLECSIIRFPEIDLDPQKIDQTFFDYIENFESKNHIQMQRPIFLDYRSENIWKYVPKLQLNEKSIYWHPLLSDYLYAFILSTILRYHPHLFKSDDENSFISEAWVNQSAINSLRYYLTFFTDPITILN